MSNPDRIVYVATDWSELPPGEAAPAVVTPQQAIRAARMRAWKLQSEVRIRLAVPADEHAVRRLAALDSQSLSAGQALGEILLAEVGEELWAAVWLDGGPAIGDPFRPTRHVIKLLSERAVQFERAGSWRETGPEGRLRRIRARRASAPARG